MPSPVKKTTFEEYRQTLATILSYVDKELTVIKNRQKNLLSWKGFDSFKDFLKHIEKFALQHASEDLKISDTTIRDRWHVMCLPLPVYSAMESEEITFSKAKFLTAINFDFENDSDIQVSDSLVEMIKSGLTNPQIKQMVQDHMSKVWNPSDIVMKRIAEQHGINEETKC